MENSDDRAVRHFPRVKERAFIMRTKERKRSVPVRVGEKQWKAVNRAGVFPARVNDFAVFGYNRVEIIALVKGNTFDVRAIGIHRMHDFGITFIILVDKAGPINRFPLFYAISLG